jgi:hypothetical protein
MGDQLLSKKYFFPEGKTALELYSRENWLKFYSKHGVPY